MREAFSIRSGEVLRGNQSLVAAHVCVWSWSIWLIMDLHSKFPHIYNFACIGPRCVCVSMCVCVCDVCWSSYFPGAQVVKPTQSIIAPPLSSASSSSSSSNLSFYHSFPAFASPTLNPPPTPRFCSVSLSFPSCCHSPLYSMHAREKQRERTREKEKKEGRDDGIMEEMSTFPAQITLCWETQEDSLFNKKEERAKEFACLSVCVCVCEGQRAVRVFASPSSSFLCAQAPAKSMLALPH